MNLFANKICNVGFPFSNSDKNLIPTLQRAEASACVIFRAMRLKKKICSIYFVFILKTLCKICANVPRIFLKECLGDLLSYRELIFR